jgi:hypothetical protein
MKKNRMSFRESIENYPLVYLISCVVAAISVVAGAVTYYTNQKLEISESKNLLKIEKIEQKHAQEISSIQQRLASIERRMGDTTDFFDVTRIMIPKEKIRGALPNATLFKDKEGRFYAFNPELDSNWAYEKTTELKLLQEISGINQEAFPKKLIESSASVPLHMRRKKYVFNIDGVKGVKLLFPLVFVQRVPHTSFPQRIGVSLLEGGNEKHKETRLEEIKGTQDKDKARLIELLDSIYRGDAAGMYLTILLEMEFQMLLTSNIRTEISSIQKKGNVIYTRLESKFSNIIVNGEKEGEFYFTREIILVSNPDELVLIKTVIPTFDHRSEDFQWISGWFGSFGIPF